MIGLRVCCRGNRRLPRAGALNGRTNGRESASRPCSRGIAKGLHPSKPVHLQIVSCLAGPWQAAWESEKAAIFELRTEIGNPFYKMIHNMIDFPRVLNIK